MNFSYHRSLSPLMWVFVALASIELVAVHLFLALKWPWLAWPLSVLTLMSLLWLVRLIRSFRSLPHRLEAGQLTLHLGSLRSLEVPLDAIHSVRAAWASGEHEEPGTARFSLIAYPNRLLDLAEPLPGRRGGIKRVAITLDDPATFDLALADARK